MRDQQIKIESLFLRKIGKRLGRVVVRSPGRVNLIGEHTDYNEGFVLPAAIDKAILDIEKKTESLDEVRTSVNLTSLGGLGRLPGWVQSC